MDKKQATKQGDTFYAQTLFHSNYPQYEHPYKLLPAAYFRNIAVLHDFSAHHFVRITWTLRLLYFAA